MGNGNASPLGLPCICWYNSLTSSAWCCSGKRKRTWAGGLSASLVWGWWHFIDLVSFKRWPVTSLPRNWVREQRSREAFVSSEEAVSTGSRGFMNWAQERWVWGPHIWPQDALSRLLDEEAWSKEVMAGSGGLLGVEAAVKVNKALLPALGVPQQVIFVCEVLSCRPLWKQKHLVSESEAHANKDRNIILLKLGIWGRWEHLPVYGEGDRKVFLPLLCCLPLDEKEFGPSERNLRIFYQLLFYCCDTAPWPKAT